MTPLKKKSFTQSHIFLLQTHRMMGTCNLYDLSKKSGQAYPPIPQVYRYFNDNAVSFNCTFFLIY